MSLTLKVLAVDCEYPGTEGKVADYYTGPLIDTHIHIPSPNDTNNGNPVLGKDMTIADIACTFNYEGTRSVFAFFPFYVGTMPHSQYYRIANRARANHENVFVRFILSPGKKDGVPTVTANRLKKIFKNHPGLYQGYGEIGFNEIENRDDGEYLPDDYLMKQIYPVIHKRDMLVYFHPGTNQVERLAEVLEENPDINFVVHGEQIENDVDELMREYSNIYFTVNDLYGDQYLLHQGETKESFLEALDNYESLLEIDLATWKEVIEAHPDQFVWGTDRGAIAAWTLDKEVGLRITDYGRAFIAQLDPAVQEKFAYKNAQKLINSVD